MDNEINTRVLFKVSRLVVVSSSTYKSVVFEHVIMQFVIENRNV